MGQTFKYLILFTYLLSSSADGSAFSEFDPSRRLHTFLEAPSKWHQTARSVVALVPRERLFATDGGYRLEGGSLMRIGLCSDQEFSDELIVANCSGSLVADDIVLSAAHCLDRNRRWCEDYAFVFDYARTKNQDEDELYFVSDQQVYFCDEILYHQLSGLMGEDLTLIRLDRKVEDRDPIELAADLPQIGDPLTMIGYPLGGPQKWVSGGQVLDVFSERMSFHHNMVTYSVNSGGPVFDSRTQKQVGVLVRGTGPMFSVNSPGQCGNWGWREGESVGEVNYLIDVWDIFRELLSL